MSNKEPKIVPIEKVRNGIIVAKKRAQTYLMSAEALAENPECANDAGLLTIHALEEIGKASILQERLEEAENNGASYIQISGRRDKFYDHPAKINAALDAMPLGLRTLTMGTFDPSRQFFQTERMEISQNLKEHISYTDYVNGEWVSPHTLNPNQLRNLILNLRELTR